MTGGGAKRKGLNLRLPYRPSWLSTICLLAVCEALHGAKTLLSPCFEASPGSLLPVPMAGI